MKPIVAHSFYSSHLFLASANERHEDEVVFFRRSSVAAVVFFVASPCLALPCLAHTDVLIYSSAGSFV